MIQISNSTIEGLNNQARELATEYYELKRKLEKINAARCAIDLINMSDDFPIFEFWYYVENEYDDERYFDVARIGFEIDSDKQAEYDAAVAEKGDPRYDYDILEAWDEETCEALFQGSHKRLGIGELHARVRQLQNG